MNYPSVTEPIGYRHGLRQPTQRLALYIQSLPAQASWPEIDAWLAAWLDQPPTEPTDLEQWQKTSDDHALAARLFWRTAQAGATLLRNSGIPVFETGRLLSIAPLDGKWQCDLALPHIEGVSAKLMQHAYDTGLRWLLKLASEPTTIHGLDDFYRELEANTLPILQTHAVAPPTTMTLLRAAWAQGIPWRHEGQGIYQLGWGRHALRIHHSHIDTDSLLGAEVAHNKLLAAQWLRRAGLPVPVHHIVSHAEHAAQAANLLGWPVVVKPVNAEGGVGVTIGIDNNAALYEAFTQAQRFAPQVLVERQAPGICYRILVVRGEAIYAVPRLPIEIQGDGRHSVAELITAENLRQLQLPPWRRSPPLPNDALAEACLRRAGYTLDSVPPAGLWLALRQIDTSTHPGRDEENPQALHPDNAALAIHAAEIMGLDVAGVDLITPDISAPWHANGGVINEINSAPTLGASHASRSSMRWVMKLLLSDKGRIPVEIFVGGSAALDAARRRQQALIAQGVACFMSSDYQTLDPTGNNMAMACQDSYLRCQALLTDKQVEAVVLALHTNDWLKTGLPVDRVSRVEVVGETDSRLLSLLRHHVAEMG